MTAQTISTPLWLMRNNAYGFGYYVTGRAVDFSKVKVLRKIKELNNEQWFSYVPGFLAPWSFYYCKQYCPWFRVRLYLGWKMKFLDDYTQVNRCQIAFSFNPFKGLEEDSTGGG